MSLDAKLIASMSSAVLLQIDYASPIRKGTVEKLFDGQAAVFETSQKCIAFTFCPSIRGVSSKTGKAQVTIYEPFERVWCDTAYLESRCRVSTNASYDELEEAMSTLVKSLLQEEEILLAKLLESITFVPAERVKKTQEFFNDLGKRSFVLSEENNINYKGIHCLIRMDPTIVSYIETNTMSSSISLYESVAIVYIHKGD